MRSSRPFSLPNRFASRRAHARSSPRRAVVLARDDVLEAGEGAVAVRRQQAQPEQHVLVGEGQQRAAELVREHALEGLVGLGVAVDERHAHQQRRGAADPLEGAERVAAQLGALAHHRHQHPLLALLGEEADVELRVPVDAEVRHLDELGVRERGGVLRACCHPHRRSILRDSRGGWPRAPEPHAALGPDVYIPVVTDAFDRRGSCLGAAATGLALAGAGAAGTALAGAAPDGLAAATGPSPAEWARFSASLTGYAVRRGQPALRGRTASSTTPSSTACAPLGIALLRDAPPTSSEPSPSRGPTGPVAVRAGGHSYGGYSSGTGRLVIDVTRSEGSSRRRRPAAPRRRGGGRAAHRRLQHARAAGQLVPAGSCPTVGFAGLALGGGVGVFARRYGLTTDHLTSLTLVTAAGEARRCAPDDHAELYWACRVGAAGTSAWSPPSRSAPTPIPPVTLFTYDFDWSAAHDLLGAWQRWTAGVADQVWSNCQLLSGGGAYARGRGRRVRHARPDRRVGRAPPARGHPGVVVPRTRRLPARDDGRGGVRPAHRGRLPPRRRAPGRGALATGVHRLVQLHRRAVRRRAPRRDRGGRRPPRARAPRLRGRPRLRRARRGGQPRRAVGHRVRAPSVPVLHPELVQLGGGRDPRAAPPGRGVARVGPRHRVRGGQRARTRTTSTRPCPTGPPPTTGRTSHASRA